MPDTSPIASVIRNTLAVKRMGNGLSRQVDSLLHDLFDDLAAQMQRHGSIISAWEPLAKPTARTTKIQSILKEFDQTIGGAFSEYKSISADYLKNVFDHQAGFAHDLLQQSLAGFGVDVSPALVGPFLAKAIVERNPFMGATMSEWAETMERATIDRVRRQIQLGVMQNETIDDMVRRVRGRAIKPGVYRGGVMSTTTREARTIVRTAVTDIAVQAQQATYMANDDITEEYEYLATLDLRTTERCAELDGQRFRYGEGPLPPQHFNCRSATIPVINWERWGIKAPPEGLRASMDGPVSAKTNFEGWLKDQPLERQVTVLGKGKAELFRSGQIGLRELIRKDGSVISLKELTAQIAGSQVQRQARKAARTGGTPVGTSVLTDQQAFDLRKWEFEHRNAPYNGDVLFTHPGNGKVLFQASEGQGTLYGRYMEPVNTPKGMMLNSQYLKSQQPVISIVNDKTWHKVADWHHFEFAAQMNATEIRILHRGQITRLIRPKNGWPMDSEALMNQWADQWAAIQTRHIDAMNAKIMAGEMRGITKDALNRQLSLDIMNDLAEEMGATVHIEKWKRSWTNQVEEWLAAQRPTGLTEAEAARRLEARASLGWERAMEDKVKFQRATTLKEANDYAEKHFVVGEAKYHSQKWTVEQANTVNQVFSRDLEPLGIKLHHVGTARMRSNCAHFVGQEPALRNKAQEIVTRARIAARKQGLSTVSIQYGNQLDLLTFENKIWDNIEFQRGALTGWSDTVRVPIGATARAKASADYLRDAAALRGELGADIMQEVMDKYGQVKGADWTIERLIVNLEEKAAIAKWNNGISNQVFMYPREEQFAAITHHEAGHAVMWRGVDTAGKPIRDRWVAELRKAGVDFVMHPITYGVSGYARKNFDELWAETWAMIRMGRRNIVPAPILQAMDACMKEWTLAADHGFAAGW